MVGGGDSAMEEATFLTRFGKSVTVVVRKGELRASRIMAQRAKDNPKISFAWNSAVTAIHGDAKVTGVTLTDTRTGETRQQAATGIFVAIGHVPRTELLTGQVELDAEGYIKVDSPTTVTNLSGVFACGDAVDHRYRQAITAAGTGCAAALDAERYLAALDDADSIATALVEEPTHAFDSGPPTHWRADMTDTPSNPARACGQHRAPAPDSARDLADRFCRCVPPQRPWNATSVESYTCAGPDREDHRPTCLPPREHCRHRTGSKLLAKSKDASQRRSPSLFVCVQNVRPVPDAPTALLTVEAKGRIHAPVAPVPRRRPRWTAAPSQLDVPEIGAWT